MGAGGAGRAGQACECVVSCLSLHALVGVAFAQPPRSRRHAARHGRRSERRGDRRRAGDVTPSRGDAVARRPARAATPLFDVARAGPLHDSRRVARASSRTDVRDVRVRAGENRREVKLAIAKLAETVQVGRDARERASDPRGDAFATVLGQQQIDELPDDPDEMEQALRDMAGPGRGAARERVPRRPAAAEEPDSADPVPPQHVRRRHARAGVRLGRHHHQAGPRQLARRRRASASATRR